MKELTKKYNSKILLIGEYTVTLGSGALAIPNNGYSGYWDFETSSNTQQHGLKKLYHHLSYHQRLKMLYRLRNFKDDLDKGLIFRSNIPQGYGLGSSGALVAGFYDRYVNTKTEYLSEQKNILAETESAFHGSSSGIDPLVSFLNVPVLIETNQEIQRVDIEIKNHNLYMLDTGIARKTEPFIDIFKNKMRSDSLFPEAVYQLGVINKNAIEAILQNDSNKLFSTIGKISEIQFKYFSEMIPNTLSDLWHTGIMCGEYYLKLCGAGGGGMMLCMPRPGTKLPQEMKSFALKEIV